MLKRWKGWRVFKDINDGKVLYKYMLSNIIIKPKRRFRLWR